MISWSRGYRKIVAGSRYAFSPIAVLLLALSYLVLLLNLGTSSPFLVVRGVSMEPTYQNGDMLLNRSVLATDIGVGDVIAFDVPEEARTKLKLAPVVAHRVIEIQGAGGQLVFLTKGDNTEIDPFKVPGGSVRGLIVSDLGPLGHPLLFLAQKKVWLYVGLPLAVFGVVVAATLALSPRQKSESSPPPVTDQLQTPASTLAQALIEEDLTARPRPPAQEVRAAPGEQLVPLVPLVPSEAETPEISVARKPSPAEARKLFPHFTRRRPPAPKPRRVPRTQKGMVQSLQEATEELRQVIANSPRTPTSLVQARRQQDPVLLQLRNYVEDPREVQPTEELEQAIDSYTRALGELEGLAKGGGSGAARG